MALFLEIHGTYHHVHVGLFEESTLLGALTINNADTSKQLIPTIDRLLNSHTVPLNHLSFIAANQGPGPFTTLRTILTTINGISFSCGMPLIGIDSLKAMAYEWQDNSFPLTVVLLDAFNKDVYFYIQDSLLAIDHAGYENIDTFLSTLMHQRHSTTPIRFIGNATLLYKQKIENIFNSHAYLPTPMPNFCSLAYCAAVSLKAWRNHETSHQLLPLYLKKHHAEKK